MGNRQFVHHKIWSSTLEIDSAKILSLHKVYHKFYDLTIPFLIILIPFCANY